MRTLTQRDLGYVAGGFGGSPGVAEVAATAAGLGGGWAANAVLGLHGNSIAGVAAVEGANTALAVGSAAVAGGAAAGVTGYAIGTYAYNNVLSSQTKDAIGGTIAEMPNVVGGWFRAIGEKIDDLFSNGK